MNLDCNVNSVVSDGWFVTEANEFCITAVSKREKLRQSPIKRSNVTTSYLKWMLLCPWASQQLSHYIIDGI